MKKEEVIKKVLKYLAQHDSGTNQDISKNIGVPFIPVAGRNQDATVSKIDSICEGEQNVSPIGF